MPDLLVSEYRKISKRRLAILSLFALSLVIVFILSLCVGSLFIPPIEVFSEILNFGSGSSRTILLEIRLPRALVAVLAGAGLALAGAVTQVSVRNPLASPFTLGISSAAGFGAALAIVLGAGEFIHSYLGGVLVFSYIPLIAASFAFSLLAMVITVFIAKLKGSTPETIILTGIAMLFLFSAATSFMQYFGTTEQVASIVFWLFGSLSKASWTGFWTIFLVFAIVSVPLYRWSYRYNALLIDDDVAKNLGVNPENLRLISMVLSSLLTATIVSFLGVIGFVCLVSPHIARMIIGSDNRYLFFASTLVGANILILSDVVSRTVLSPIILPVGIITSFLGVPLLFYLILKRKRYSY
ncbi:MAG: FecCD family ABC transporter permease [Candidatus Methanomethylicaceae archaeon]